MLPIMTFWAVQVDLVGTYNYAEKNNNDDHSNDDNKLLWAFHVLCRLWLV